MFKHAHTHTQVSMILGNEIHLLNYPAWIINDKTLRIVDANYKAMDFCKNEVHEMIGLSILDLWHDENLLHILNDFVIEHFERCFFSSLRHKKNNGEMEIFRIRATRQLHSKNNWTVHLVEKTERF